MVLVLRRDANKNVARISESKKGVVTKRYTLTRSTSLHSHGRPHVGNSVDTFSQT